MRKQWAQPNVFLGATPPPYAYLREGDAHAGEQTYQARCSACHAPSHQQITSPDYLALVGDQALRTMVIAGRPDIGQPDWSHLGRGGKAAPPLSEQDVDNVIAYLASLRGPMPAVNGFPMQPAPASPKGR
jgi:cytochrome c oxidase cbb3-type subunit III